MLTEILQDPGLVAGLIFVAFLAGVVVGAKAMEVIDRPRRPIRLSHPAEKP